MSGQLSILKPQIKHRYLKNSMMEQVTYLDIAGHVGIEDLRRDVRNGAVHMKELEALVTKKNEPRYIIVNAATREQGFLAISYLAACFAQKHGCKWEEADEETEEDGGRPEYAVEEEGGTSDAEAWEESPYRIPIVEYAELNMYVGGNFANAPFFDMNNITYGAGGRGRSDLPYWYRCRRESVCIVFENLGYYNKIDLLDLFRENEKVYILTVDENLARCEEPGDSQESVRPSDWDRSGESIDWDNMGWEPMDDDMPMLIDALRTSILLTYAADEIQVALKGKEEKRYYKKVFQSHLMQRNIKVKKGFSYEKLLHIVMALDRQRVCDMIEKVVLYAIKDKEYTDDLVLTNADFLFVSRFVRTCAVRDGGKRQPAAERMEKELVGMESVKRQVMDVVNVMKFNKMRTEMGIKGSQYHNVHLMLGAPGTAKTTVAKLMGQIMVEEKLLPDNRFVCVNGAELKGMYVGHSAPKTKSLFENNDIIVIDEAYSIVGVDGQTDYFSNEAIAQMVIELENHATDKLVIFAGYGGMDVEAKNNRMKLFLDANPGIRSRINSTFYFESYSADEMVSIFFRIARNENYKVEQGVAPELREYFEYRRKDDNFGNGRDARSLLEASLLEMAGRVMGQKGKKPSKQDMQLIRAEDVRRAIAKARRGGEAQNGRTARAAGF